MTIFPPRMCRRLSRVAFLPVVFLPFFFSMRRRVLTFILRRRPPRVAPAAPPSSFGCTPPEDMFSMLTPQKKRGVAVFLWCCGLSVDDVSTLLLATAAAATAATATTSGPGRGRTSRTDIATNASSIRRAPAAAHVQALHQRGLLARGLHALLLQHATQGLGLQGASLVRATGTASVDWLACCAVGAARTVPTQSSCITANFSSTASVGRLRSVRDRHLIYLKLRFIPSGA